MNNYNYEDVKQAYKAIIEVGKVSASTSMLGTFGGNFLVQNQHRKNLKNLDGAALELYEKLLNDEDINY